MDEKLLQSLLDSIDIVDIVGNRIYPLIASQDENNPYIVFTNIFQEYDNTLNCQVLDFTSRYQLDFYSKSHSDIKDMRYYMMIALSETDLFDCVINSSFDSIEDGGKWYRVSMDANLHGSIEKPLSYLTDDAGNILTDEAGNRLTT